MPYVVYWYEEPEYRRSCYFFNLPDAWKFFQEMWDRGEDVLEPEEFE